MSNNTSCPCGIPKDYTLCCQPLHIGTQIAKTAEQLMRSRYSAFAKNLVDYLVNTEHPDNRSIDLKESIRLSQINVKWIKLTILETQKGSEKDDEGIVEFSAVYRDHNPRQFRERSRFQKLGGLWYYLDGDRKLPLIPLRNELCWCQSGKKFKKCHGH